MATLSLTEVFDAIDSKDADRFASFLTENAVFRYGSQKAVQGKAAVRDYVAGFFGTVEALRHQVVDTWEREDSIVVQGVVTYTQHDGGEISVPFANIFRLEGDRIRDYLIFVDPTPLAG